MQTHHGTLDTVIMPTIGIGEDTVLVLQTAISSDWRVLDGRKRTTKLGLEWP